MTEQEIEALEALMARITAVIKGEEHWRALSALLTVYRHVSLCHPCCALSAADACAQVGAALLLRASQSAPTGASVH